MNLTLSDNAIQHKRKLTNKISDIKRKRIIENPLSALFWCENCLHHTGNDEGMHGMDDKCAYDNCTCKVRKPFNLELHINLNYMAANLGIK